MFGTALANYEMQTGKDLSKHPFADKLRGCDSADSVLHLFQEHYTISTIPIKRTSPIFTRAVLK